MATAYTATHYLKCVNHEVDGGCGKIQVERFSWGLGGKLMKAKVGAKRCTGLCESNMNALLKDFCVSLPMVIFRNSQANKDSYSCCLAAVKWKRLLKCECCKSLTYTPLPLLLTLICSRFSMYVHITCPIWLFNSCCSY